MPRAPKLLAQLFVDYLVLDAFHAGQRWLIRRVRHR